MADPEKVRRAFLDAVEHAIQNELDSFTSEDIARDRGYIAETVAWRLDRDGFLAAQREVT